MILQIFLMDPVTSSSEHRLKLYRRRSVFIDKVKYSLSVANDYCIKLSELHDIGSTSAKNSMVAIFIEKR